MSVIGFDIGNLNCFVAVARAGGIETIANEYSDRCTPAIVGFNNVQRLVGISAKNQIIMNYKNTVCQFKRLIGRKFDEPEVQAEIKRHPNTFLRKNNGDIGIQVQYKGESTVYSPEQLLGMVLTELKTTTQAELKTKVTDCVISVPTYFTDYQRRCFLEAVKISGLNCLKLMNDTTAISLTYGLFKQDLPGTEEKPRYVAFVDCGHSSLQVCITAFNKGKIKILSTASDPNLGGRDFDDRLINYFVDAFKEKYKIDVRENKKALMRLTDSVEKIKKQLSTNTTDLPMNIECLMNDIDVSHRVNRTQFEEMCEDLLSRLDAPMTKALEESGLKVDEIDVVEIVGGSSRIPALKSTLERVFKKIPSKTQNLDEAVARGCAIQCAMLSHTVKVRDIEVQDAAPYPIHISWDSVKPDDAPGVMEVFKKNHNYPFTKMLTFPHRIQPFRFKAYYKDDIDLQHFEREIGEFVVNVANPEVQAEKVKVKVKVRLDVNGCFTVCSATQLETLPPPPSEEPKQEEASTEEAKTELMETNEKVEKKDEQGSKDKDDDETMAADSESNNPASTDAAVADGNKEDSKAGAVTKGAKKTKKSKSIELIVTKNQACLKAEELNRMIEIENDLVSAVRQEKERTEAKNTVEEYIYRMRDKIYSDYENNMTEKDREAFSSLLSQTEDWLYDEGEDEKRQTYVDKLAELKKYGQPVADRHDAHSYLPSAFEALGSSLTHFRKILNLYADKDEKYEHLDSAEMNKVQKKLDEKQDWFNKRMQENANCKPTENPLVLPVQIMNEKKLLDDFCNPIVNKSKPKVEPPKENAKDDKNSAEVNSQANTTQEGKTAEQMETEQTAEKPAEGNGNNMEVD